MKLRKHVFPRCLGDFLSFVFLLLMLPIGYWFEVFLVLPSMYPVTSAWYIIHIIISTVLLVNITSNFMYMILMDTSIQGELMPSVLITPNWKFCTVCESVTPPRSWHCNICNICILKRDHHCQFGGCCIGHNNQRYFMCFLAYLASACVYIFYLNTYFMIPYFKFSISATLKFIFPLAIFLLGVDHSLEHFYTLFYVINILGMITASFLLYYHGSSLIRGLVMHEKTHNIYDYDLGSIKGNILQVFGERWYLTWVSPFVHSKLPTDGIHWVKSNSKLK